MKICIINIKFSLIFQNSKKGRFCFELHMVDTDKTYCLASDSEPELMDWITKLQMALQCSHKKEEKTIENNSMNININLFKIFYRKLCNK